jgi:Mn2+/Fe2+ NRAMP family transporter
MVSGQARAVEQAAVAGRVELAEPPKGLMILSMLGPGIVWAGLAIGGGELVLIPRVGSVYGMMFLWMPLLAIAVKYFMLNEIGRWSIVTGTSIFDGLAMIPGPRKWLSWVLLFVSLYLGAVHIGGLVSMVGVIFHTIVQVFTPFVWSIVIMVSFVAVSWTNKYSILEKVLIVFVGLLTISAVLIGFAFIPPLKDLAEGFAFHVPSVTPDWAVTNYKISKSPMVEILPAMAFAGCGALNSLWYSDWALSKGFGMGKYFDGLENTAVKYGDLRNLDRPTVIRIKGWLRVMFHDCLWGANFLTILVTFSYLVLAIVILHPIKEAPGGLKFITTLSQTFTKTLGPWAHWLYLIGAFGVIYSTMATVYDGYARTINKLILICAPNWEGYRRLSPIWRYRTWFLYGTLANFFLVYMFNAVPVDFLQAAAWVEGTFLLPVVAFAIAYLTAKKLPSYFNESTRDLIKPNPIFTIGTIAAGIFYIILIWLLIAR